MLGLRPVRGQLRPSVTNNRFPEVAIAIFFVLHDESGMDLQLSPGVPRLRVMHTDIKSPRTPQTTLDCVIWV